MICTNKRKKQLLCILCVAVLFVTGCGNVKLNNEYSYLDADVASVDAQEVNLQFYGNGLCVGGTENTVTDAIHYDVAEAAGVFNIDKKEIPFSKNIYEQLYPASLTKVLTALIIIQNCTLSDQVTISENAVNLSSDSSVCKLNAGDVVSVKDLLNGLLLASGNDAAIALAEYYAGSEEEFARIMNETARELGCTGSNFVNASGLPNESHYTTVYDMYLIFQEALKYDSFVSIIDSPSYDALYTNSVGESVSNHWENTIRYKTGSKEAPANMQVIGGKTGTTGAAGYCLMLYSENGSGEHVISIVFKAGGVSDLYMLMNELMSQYGNL